MSVRDELQRMAEAHARGLAEIEAAKAEVARIDALLDPAIKHLYEVKDAVEIIEAGMHVTQRQYLILKTLEERGIETEEPALVLVNQQSRGRPPEVWELVAVAIDGVGLYQRRPKHSHRYDGIAWGVLHARVPERAEESYHKMREAGLLYWQSRGTGQYGAGTGGMRPDPPPNGGRWRWLKVQDQNLLESGG